MSTVAILATLGLSRLLRLWCCSPVMVEDKGAQGHAQVGPAHTSLAAEEQCWRGAAGIPQQQARALLGRDRDGWCPEAARRAQAWTSPHGDQADVQPHQ